MERIERQELHCHDCNKYVQFDIDLSLNGNHVLECPNCGHEHCRVVKDGIITSERWDQRNGDSGTVFTTTNITWTTASTWDTYIGTGQTVSNQPTQTGTAQVSGTAGTDVFLYNSWLNTGSTAS